MPPLPRPLSNLHIERLLPRVRMMALIAGACIVVSVIAVMSLSGGKEYEVLYGDLVAADAAGIVGRLKEQGVPYRLSSDGSTIEVPREQAAELRLTLATEGFPKGGGVGYEIFDKSSFGQTDFTQRMNYIRALQGELERMIGALSPVANARVILQIPQESIYLDEEPKPPTASVVIGIREGAGFTRAEVRGIKNLVANSVPGMSTGNVTIVDMTGKILSDEEPQSTDRSIPNEFVVLQRDHEGLLQSRIQSMLDSVLGPGKSVVRVNAEMDMDSLERHSETFDPIPGTTAGVVRSRADTRSGGSTPVTGAEVGVTANDGSGVGTGAQAGIAGQDSSTVNYEISKRQEKVVRTPGGIKRITVSVLVDSVDPAQLPQLKDAVRSAAGVDESRGDVVVLESIEFSSSRITPDAKGSETTTKESKPAVPGFGKEALMGAGAGLLALLVLMLVLGAGRKRKGKGKQKGKAKGDQVAETPDIPAIALEAAAAAEPLEPIVEEAPVYRNRKPVLDLSEERGEKNELFDEIEKRIKKDPMAASVIIKGWMSEEE